MKFYSISIKFSVKKKKKLILLQYNCTTLTQSIKMIVIERIPVHNFSLSVKHRYLQDIKMGHFVYLFYQENLPFPLSIYSRFKV